MKKEAYEIWNVKEHCGADFDPDQIFCWDVKEVQISYKTDKG